MNRNILIIIVAVILLVAGGWWYMNQQASPMAVETQLQGKQNAGNNVQQPQSGSQAAPSTGSAYTAASLTATPTAGAAPLSVNFKGYIDVPANQPGNAIIFFGDSTSDVMSRTGPALYDETWSHTYAKAGLYSATLVLTSESNVDTDIEVMKNPNYAKNIIVKTVRVTVQ